MQCRKPKNVYKTGMHLLIHYEDIDQLRERLISMWCELDQSVVNHAIDEWRRRPVSYTHLTLPTNREV